jgi:ribose 5-phosphate isomerase B
MKIYIGADHQGYQKREGLLKFLQDQGYTIADKGDDTLDLVDDYPQFAGRVASAVLASDDSDARGILLCGSGQGMCMAANRFKGIRACLGYDRQSVKSARNDDDSNVLCLPARILSSDKTFEIVDVWLKTPFSKAPRFIRRNRELDELG